MPEKGQWSSISPRSNHRERLSPLLKVLPISEVPISEVLKISQDIAENFAIAHLPKICYRLQAGFEDRVLAWNLRTCK